MIEKPKVRVYSVVSEPFRFGFLVMARTLVARNPQFEFSFRVLHHSELCPLSQTTQDWFVSHVGAVDFVEVDLAPYKNIFDLRDNEFKTPKRLWAAFIVLEAFRDPTKDYHVICLDSDLVCMGTLGDELIRSQGFAAVEARTDGGVPRGFFNTGVMALAPDVRGPEAFARIMGINSAEGYHPASGKADQAVLSLVYSPDNAKSLPWRYNVTKRHVPEQGVENFLAEMDTVFYHYVGSKPWHVSLDVRDRHDQESVALWDRVVNEHFSQEELLEYYEAWRDTSRALAYAQMDERLVPPKRRFPVKKIKRYAKNARRLVRRVSRRMRGA